MIEQQFISSDGADSELGGQAKGIAPSHSGSLTTLEEDDYVVKESDTSAGWPEVTIHLVTTMFGAGVLGLPYAWACLGIAGGAATLTLAVLLSFYSAHLLARLHQLRDGRRMRTLRALAREVLGVWGERVVVTTQVFIMVTLGIIFSVAAGESITNMVHGCHRVDGATACDTADPKTWPWTVLFGGCMMLLAQLPSFHDLAAVSLVGSIAPLVYSGVAFVSVLVHGPEEGRDYSIIRGDNNFQTAMSVLNGIGSFFFSFGGQVVQNEITATLKTPPSILTSMRKALAVSYLTIGAGYYAVAAAGYACFGNTVAPNVMESLPYEVPAYVANCAVVLHMAASYQVIGMSVYKALEVRAAKAACIRGRLGSRLLLRLLVRSAYCGTLTLVAVVIPFFSNLGGLIGGLGALPLCFLLPVLMWQHYNRKTAGRVLAAANWALVGLFAVLVAATTIASVYGIQQSAHTFELFR